VPAKKFLICLRSPGFKLQRQFNCEVSYRLGASANGFSNIHTKEKAMHAGRRSGGPGRAPLERQEEARVTSKADLKPFRALPLESGIDFPGGYEKVGQTRNPATLLEVDVWKPRIGR
jgi:hypothetical protein